ncbi:MAG: DUF362 domain-containing protein [Actinobacteria bacterium]|nr:DUF362 domain-containing protein [Actinomycetota bacterium]
MSKVYFISSRADSRERNLTKYQRLLKNLSLNRVVAGGDLVAIKLSFGERGNFNYLRPQYVRVVVDEIKRLGGRPFLTDANTLYAGGRHNSRDHLITALENGFGYEVTGAPIVIADGLLGHDYRSVPVDGAHFREVKISSVPLDADAIISLAHFKGHMVCGFGGTIKNMGMGFGARPGKQMMHSDVHPEVNQELCDACARCRKWCPEGAITLVEGSEAAGHKVALIDDEACIGCGECVATCFTGAISVVWKSDPRIVQEKTAEYMAGVLAGKEGKFAAINYIMGVTPDCDCLGWNDSAIVPDIGIAASLDPIAADAAALDMVNAALGIPGGALGEKDLASGDKFGSIHHGIDATAQLAHGERLGLGTRDYDLVKLDKDDVEGHKENSNE